MRDSTTPSPPSGPEHDAWLREALRHAPDSSAAPPLSLREAILAEARAATRAGHRTAPSPSLADRFAEFWSWLVRPPVAAGFASIMAATLVGLMWWDRPLDETLPRAPEPVVAARAPTPIADRPTPAPDAPPALAEPATATPKPAPQVAPVEALRPAPNAAVATMAERAATTDRSAQRAVAAAPTPPAEAFAPPSKTATATDALGDKRKDAGPSSSNVASALAPAPKSQTLPTPFPARDASDSGTPAPARSEPSALAKKAEKNDAQEWEKREAVVGQNRLAAAPPATILPTAPSASTGAGPTGALDPSMGASADTDAKRRLAAQPRSAAVARQRAAEVAATTARPMAPLLVALASEGPRWKRSNAAGGGVAVVAAVQAWLARVDAVASQWESLAERLSRTDAARAADAGTLLLYREGRIAAIVEIEDDGVFFEARPGSSWFAPLAPDTVARLRATLPAAGR